MFCIVFRIAVSAQAATFVRRRIGHPSHFVAKEAVQVQQHPMQQLLTVKKESKETTQRLTAVKQEDRSSVSAPEREMVYIAFCPFHDANKQAPLDKTLIGR